MNVSVVVEIPDEEKLTGQPLVPILAFLENLTMNDSDGRILVTTGNTVGKTSIKFLLLNPAASVKDLVSGAR